MQGSFFETKLFHVSGRCRGNFNTLFEATSLHVARYTWCVLPRQHNNTVRRKLVWLPLPPFNARVWLRLVSTKQLNIHMFWSMHEYTTRCLRKHMPEICARAKAIATDHTYVAVRCSLWLFWPLSLGQIKHLPITYRMSVASLFLTLSGWNGDVEIENGYSVISGWLNDNSKILFCSLLIEVQCSAATMLHNKWWRRELYAHRACATLILQT